MTQPTPPQCVSCGADRQLELIGPQAYEGYGCPAHLHGLRGQLTDELADLTWLQETRAQRLHDRHL